MIEYRVIPPPQQASLPVSTGAQLTLPRQGESQDVDLCVRGRYRVDPKGARR